MHYQNKFTIKEANVYLIQQYQLIFHKKPSKSLRNAMTGFILGYVSSLKHQGELIKNDTAENYELTLEQMMTISNTFIIMYTNYLDQQKSKANNNSEKGSD